MRRNWLIFTIALAAFVAGSICPDVIRDAWAGKGDIDGRLIVDTDGTSTSRLVELHIYDGIPDEDWSDVKSTAATSQAAFDTELAGIFSWYSGQPAVFKSRLRTSVNAL